MSVGIRRREISLYEENGEMSCMYSALSVGSKDSGEMVLVTQQKIRCPLLLVCGFCTTGPA